MSSNVADTVPPTSASSSRSPSPNSDVNCFVDTNSEGERDEAFENDSNTIVNQTASNALAGKSVHTDSEMNNEAVDASNDAVNSDPFALDETFDLQRWLQAYAEVEKAHGILPRRSGVRIRDLNVFGAGSGFEFNNSFLDMLMLPIIKFRERQVHQKNILSNINCMANAGEVVLILGRPGAGCSTFLRSVKGDMIHYKDYSYDISFDGLDQDTMKKYFASDVVYSGENDVHFPTLTTKQTFDFSGLMRTPRNRPCNLTRDQYAAKLRDLLARTLGLSHTYKTKVGNDFIRGVSGGERKRVSIGESLSSRASVVCWDNSTRGLDASTALEFVEALRALSAVLKVTSFVTVYQASENMYRLFDRVGVLYNGRMIYYGPRSEARQYFIDMGFECHERETTPDFLTAVTDPNARKPRKGFEDRVPRNAEEFEQAWVNSPLYQSLLSEMAEYDQRWDESTPSTAVASSSDTDSLTNVSAKEKHELYRESFIAEKMKREKKDSPYLITFPMQLRYCFRRSWQRTINDPAFIGSMAFAYLFQGLIIGSVFWQIPENTTGLFSRGSILFFAVLFSALQTMSEIANFFAQRPILSKHKTSALYHPAADVLSSLIVDIPFRLINITILCILLYFMGHLKMNAGAFFIFYLFIFMASLCMAAFFRALASVSPNVEFASAVGGMGVLVISIYTGFTIPSIYVGWWFRWLSYLNPAQFAFESVLSNELRHRNVPCAQMIPYGGQYDSLPDTYKVCPVTTGLPGTNVINGEEFLTASYNYTPNHIWRNFGIIIGFWFFFLFINLVATEYLNYSNERGEFLVFRRGHAPKAVTDAVKGSEKPLDLETGLPPDQADVVKAERQTDTNDEKYNSIAKSEDIFCWRHLNYDITIKGEKRRLLNDVQGFVVPGKLTALMGESGAGKTTLLNVLAQRVDIGVVTGDQKVNGYPLPATFQRSTGYVQQQDVHIAECTVREALRFSAALRQPKSVPMKEKYEYVESVIEMLEMQDYADAIIGLPGSGLNVEQRKRATIGVELAAKPVLLLFLDEPTSGLDSQSAWSIVCFLRKLADAGQAILCTIHQPSSMLFSQFERLLLLQRGGKTVYFGDIGENSETLINYFQSHGGRKCDPTENPAEYILEVIGAGATAKVDRDWSEVWNNSDEVQKVSEEVNHYLEPIPGRDPGNVSKEERSKFAMPLWTQLRFVLIRTFQSYWRAPSLLLSKLVLNVFAGLFQGFTFYKQGLGVQNVQNKLFAVFMATVIATAFINGLQPKFMALRDVFEVREKPSNIYSWIAFVIAAIIVEIPFNLVFGSIFFLCWFYTVGFERHLPHSSDRTGYAWLMYMLFQLYFSTFGQAIASACPNPQTASVINGMLFSFVITFNGVLQPPAQLVKFWHWMHRLTPFTYIIEGILGDLIHDVPVVCSEKEINLINPPQGQTCQEYLGPFLQSAYGYITNPNATSSCEYCRYSYADQMIAGFDMKFAHRWRNFGITFGYVAFNALAMILLFYLFRVLKFKSTWLGKKLKGVA
ncbi:brefeldin A resistance protein [Schizosaccharomyces japonicus yFS275]|uniref:Brefeldin A resistance protein n=1 Tax=Schizosaccharomyces japonicus (strain yFS275 / FY16936) TaxID=402676 RepID=B6K6E7_SCHJY|nr:brefeldin A resistance protein [Schizosaccharomyces japonicus yFS275]EEB09101.1 brefeldin A resistance protein [Schizosaccharomyces japonicus yFS275]